MIKNIYIEIYKRTYDIPTDEEGYCWGGDDDYADFFDPKPHNGEKW